MHFPDWHWEISVHLGILKSVIWTFGHVFCLKNNRVAFLIAVLFSRMGTFTESCVLYGRFRVSCIHVLCRFHILYHAFKVLCFTFVFKINQGLKLWRLMLGDSLLNPVSEISADRHNWTIYFILFYLCLRNADAACHSSPAWVAWVNVRTYWVIW